MTTHRIFQVWFGLALLVWSIAFLATRAYAVLDETWLYPAIMVLGAFVAGLTPEGGGAVAFPVLSVVFEINREVARDFSLMIQSIGMTSASIFILTRPGLDRSVFLPLLWFLPITLTGFVVGMLTLQGLPVMVIQALFLSLITTFSLAYVLSGHRGDRARVGRTTGRDQLWLGAVLFLGGLCASLFGTGADILLYTVLVTRLRLQEKLATHFSIILMAATSLFGFAWRALVEGALVERQYEAWLAAWPVVLIMAPFGVYILSRIPVGWMLKGIVLLNLAQLVYFNLRAPSVERLAVSIAFSLILMAVFSFAFRRLRDGGVKTA